MEPSIEMLTAANAHPRVYYVGGAGEAIPLADAACDMIFMSMVLHHLRDVFLTASELARVTKRNGHLFVRAAFRENLDGIPHYEYFPSARAIDLRRLPSLDGTIDLFSQAWFNLISADVVYQVVAPDLSAYAERMSLRAISTLNLLSDREFHESLKVIREAASRTAPRPVIEASNLLVLKRQ